jgi:hypothetical protein
VDAFENVSARFNMIDSIAVTIHRNQMGSFCETNGFHSWASSVMSLLQDVFGTGSAHFQNFKRLYDGSSTTEDDLNSLRGVYVAAKSDFSNGFLKRLETSLTGDILGDFVKLAKEALREGYKDVAAVLASAALEDVLKRYATTKGLEVSDKVMQEVVSALKAAGLVSGAQKSLLDTMPKLRDYAMHANWDKLGPEDVSAVIGFVEQFLLSKF